MDIQFKQSLREKLLQFSAEFNLGDICFPSFSAQMGFHPQFAAADVVYSVSALLEAGPNFDNVERPTPSEGDAASAASARDELWTQNVYRAYDALNLRNVDMLQRGLELCMAQQIGRAHV